MGTPGAPEYPGGKFKINKKVKATIIIIVGKKEGKLKVCCRKELRFEVWAVEGAG